MRSDQVYIVLTSLVAAMVALGWTARGLRRMFRILGKANRFLDQMLGAPAQGDRPARPGLMQRVENIETQVARHLESHGQAPTSRPNMSKPADGRRIGRAAT